MLALYILHAEVRWLSKGKVLSRIHELQNEFLTFLRQGMSSFVITLKMICGCLDWNI